MLEASLRPTNHYPYHYSYHHLHSASQQLSHASLIATRAQWQRGMYSIAVEVGTVLPVGFVSCKERLRLRTWLPSMFTDFWC